MLICLAKMTLHKSVANELGNVFVPNGTPCSSAVLGWRCNALFLASFVGHAPKGSYSPAGRSKHFMEALLLRTPSENPSENSCSLQ